MNQCLRWEGKCSGFDRGTHWARLQVSLALFRSDYSTSQTKVLAGSRMQLCVDPFSTRQSVVRTCYHHITFALCHITDYDLHTTIAAGSGEEYFDHGVRR
jgi:hypothetical protein